MKSDPLSRDEVAALVGRALQGDLTARHRLYDEFGPAVRAALAPYRRHSQLYRDLRSQSYIVFHGLIDHYDARRGASFATFVARTLPRAVRFAAMREWKAEHGTPHSEDDAPSESSVSASTPDAHASLSSALEEHGAWERRATPERIALIHLALQRVMSELPAHQQQVVRLRLADWSFEEIAAELGKTTAACRQLFHRACLRLREALEGIL